MLWRDEIKIVEDLATKLTNLGSDISRQTIQAQSRLDTMNNELRKLDGDYQVILSRNEEAKKEFQKSRRLDLEQFEEARRRVQQRELALLEKEKELRAMRAELEVEIASAKSTKNTMEALGRNHVRK